jgi:transposase
MARELVDDELWEIVRPLLPLPPPHKTSAGRKRLNERRVFTGILFILQSGLPWEMLPQEMGCGSGMTCWRRARDWQKAGVWDKLHRVLLAKLRNANRLDFSRVIADSSSVRAVHGGKKLVPTRLIGARRAASTTCSSTPTASRSMSS